MKIEKIVILKQIITSKYTYLDKSDYDPSKGDVFVEKYDVLCALRPRKSSRYEGMFQAKWAGSDKVVYGETPQEAINKLVEEE